MIDEIINPIDIVVIILSSSFIVLILLITLTRRPSRKKVSAYDSSSWLKRAYKLEVSWLQTALVYDMLRIGFSVLSVLLPVVVLLNMAYLRNGIAQNVHIGIYTLLASLSSILVIITDFKERSICFRCAYKDLQDALLLYETKETTAMEVLQAIKAGELLIEKGSR